MQVKFTVNGEPKGKGRPRFTKSGHAYTPKDTAEYEALVRAEYMRQCGGVSFDKGVMLGLHVMAYYGIPKSVSKKKRLQMLSGQIRPTKKPDTDNIVKIIADSLNGVVYYDDAQLVDTTVHKFYAEKPRVEAAITEVGE